MERAKKNRFSEAGGEHPNKLLARYRDTLQIRLGSDKPAKVEPMKLTLKDGAVPFMEKPRRFTAEQRGFINKYVGKLEEFGFGQIQHECHVGSRTCSSTKTASRKVPHHVRPVSSQRRHCTNDMDYA